MAQAKAKTAAKGDRRTAILDAAAEVFLAGGYERACIDDVIAKVGGSKRTIYDAFGSKEGLFGEMMRHMLARGIASLADTRSDTADLKAALTEFGLAFMRLINSREAIALYRLVSGEAGHFPELGRIFYETGPAQTRARLTAILDDFRKRGEVEFADTGLAADAFVSMIRGNHHFQIVLGLRPPLTPKEMKEIVEAKVEIFVNGIRARKARG